MIVCPHCKNESREYYSTGASKRFWHPECLRKHNRERNKINDEVVRRLLGGKGVPSATNEKLAGILGKSTSWVIYEKQRIREIVERELSTRLSESVMDDAPLRTREYSQSAIERADDDQLLLAAIGDRLSRKKVNRSLSRVIRKEQPMWYLTLTGYDSEGNESLKTGFTGYENSTRPEAAKTYNPRATKKLIEWPNICSTDTNVWEETLRNFMRRELQSTAQLDHEVFYAVPANREQVTQAFRVAAGKTELLYRGRN